MRTFTNLIFAIFVLMTPHKSYGARFCVDALKSASMSSVQKVKSLFPTDVVFNQFQEGDRIVTRDSPDPAAELQLRLLEKLLDSRAAAKSSDFSLLALSIQGDSDQMSRDAIIRYLSNIESALPAKIEVTHMGHWELRSSAPIDKIMLLSLAGMFYGSAISATRALAAIFPGMQFNPSLFGLVGIIGSFCAVGGSCALDYYKWRKNSDRLWQKTSAFFAEVRGRLRDAHKKSSDRLIFNIEESREGKPSRYQLEFTNYQGRTPKLTIVYTDGN